MEFHEFSGRIAAAMMQDSGDDDAALSSSRIGTTYTWLLPATRPQAYEISLTLELSTLGIGANENNYFQRMYSQMVELVEPVHLPRLVPTTLEEWLKIAEGYETIWQFPHCIGALDGKHRYLSRDNIEVLPTDNVVDLDTNNNNNPSVAAIAIREELREYFISTTGEVHGSTNMQVKYLKEKKGLPQEFPECLHPVMALHWFRDPEIGLQALRLDQPIRLVE
ncbi:hypothetical protein MSG28_005949 [Choristoneura fumiferana]|uniref:Uncharacterized protein n=1 Tax=Choristoneura fumiferana TaxID=7141 RepID=A0ACC0L0R8_CHOFU|nr:hypothetical protein MSG28_005949 [Choristoneura fumiferana]